MVAIIIRINFLFLIDHRSSIESATIVNVDIDDPDIIYQNVNNSKSSVLYIPGFTEKPSDESVRTIVDGKFTELIINFI